MRLTVVPVLIGFASVALAAGDYLWFERDWISDPVATFRENPDYERLPDDLRERWRAQFGKIRWHVSDGMLEFIPPDNLPWAQPYFIRPINEDSFELITNDGATMTLRRRGDGFCIETESPSSVGTGKPFVIECFAPHDA